MSLLVLLVMVIALAGWLTARLRRYALVRSLVDVPNARSSHQIPTPRGGGVAIVVSFLLVLPLMEWLGVMAGAMVIALWGAGAWVAIVGFVDDHRHIAARWRLLAHFLGACWLLYWLPELPPLMLLGHVLELGWLGYALAALFLVWLLNLYNFMDGIDGIASVEALTVCMGGAAIYFLLDQPVLALAPTLLAAAVGGFLFWNFPPAKIFMGDAGSGFLGLMLGGLALHAAWVDPVLLWSWLIMLGVFVVDATWTLLHRLLRRERVFEAHRSHAYQFAARKYASHRAVTLTVLAINVLWLMPWALVAALQWVDGVIALACAYIPLFWLALRFKAGYAETERSV
ncbi:glycosyltransferase family 4 protein [Halopseudomonas phragmitis]|uniref:Glycosyl transferase n=1 Tax=Halopseudomonas phragmitis TaxID=1931241 RepID=A0A1V0B5T6_9GAMM|nr:glycosyltransferase family 4 protein [Halopseudomonas phragmitis]AQZ95287.1 glycosyl transferase [Halopseudomonas phragmitis]